MVKLDGFLPAGQDYRDVVDGPVRRDQLDRDVRARGLEEPRGVLRPALLVAPARRASAEPWDRAAGAPGEDAHACADPAAELHRATCSPTASCTSWAPWCRGCRPRGSTCGNWRGACMP